MFPANVAEIDTTPGELDSRRATAHATKQQNESRKKNVVLLTHDTAYAAEYACAKQSVVRIPSLERKAHISRRTWVRLRR